MSFRLRQCKRSIRHRSASATNGRIELYTMQGKVRCTRDGAARHHSLELRSCSQPLHVFMASALRCGLALMRDADLGQPTQRASLDSQTFAALGTARIYNGAAAPGLHADQKAVGARAANFGRLVCAFHLEIR